MALPQRQRRRRDPRERLADQDLPVPLQPYLVSSFSSPTISSRDGPATAREGRLRSLRRPIRSPRFEAREPPHGPPSPVPTGRCCRSVGSVGLALLLALSLLLLTRARNRALQSAGCERHSDCPSPHLGHPFEETADERRLAALRGVGIGTREPFREAEAQVTQFSAFPGVATVLKAQASRRGAGSRAPRAAPREAGQTGPPATGRVRQGRFLLRPVHSRSGS